MPKGVGEGGKGGRAGGADPRRLLLSRGGRLHRGGGRGAARRTEAGRSRTAAAGVVLCTWPAEEDRRPGRPLPVAGRAARGGGAAPARRGEPRLADLQPEPRRAAGVDRAGAGQRTREGRPPGPGRATSDTKPPMTTTKDVFG